MNGRDSAVKSLSELQWTHETLIRLIGVIQKHGLMGIDLQQAIFHIGKGTFYLEGVIQAMLAHAHRRKDDAVQRQEVEDSEWPASPMEKTEGSESGSPAD